MGGMYLYSNPTCTNISGLSVAASMTCASIVLEEENKCKHLIKPSVSSNSQECYSLSFIVLACSRDVELDLQSLPYFAVKTLHIDSILQPQKQYLIKNSIF
jgi:hypothetical protein